MSDKPVSAPESVVSAVTSFTMQHIELYKSAGDMRSEGYLVELLKEASSSHQSVKLGPQKHPFDMTQVKTFFTGNEYHSACIKAKVSSSTGLGYVDGEEEVEVTPADPLTGAPAKTRTEFKEAQADKLLNPLCSISWADLTNDFSEDFFTTGNGYIEVIRDNPEGSIIGLHHLSADQPVIYVEDTSYNFHYEIRKQEGSGAVRRFARFGDGAGFLERSKGSGVLFELPQGQPKDTVTEVIHLRQPTSLSRWYGFPDWLSAVPDIELSQMFMQHKYDFYLNRGVPEFMLFITGQQLQPDDWEKVEKALKANIGLGNAHKSLALNLASSEMKITLEKLGIEGKNEDELGSTKEALGSAIVTAHRVPPLLAGIQIPGKLGANNELPNALMAFQILVIGPVQRLFQQILGQTLGGDNGVTGVDMKTFAFQRITDQIDLDAMDTVSRMRQPVTQASAQGRNISDGLKD